MITNIFLLLLLYRNTERHQSPWNHQDWTPRSRKRLQKAVSKWRWSPMKWMPRLTNGTVQWTTRIMILSKGLRTCRRWPFRCTNLRRARAVSEPLRTCSRRPSILPRRQIVFTRLLGSFHIRWGCRRPNVAIDNKIIVLCRTQKVPAGPPKKELLDQLDKVPTYVQTLQFTVKEPTVGKSATFVKVDHVIQETKNLMNIISKVVSTCFDCANKVSFLLWIALHTNMSRKLHQ